MKYLFHLVMLVVVADLVMALAGYSLNYDRRIVQPGESYFAEEFGDLGAQKTPTLACRYWTGIGSRFAIYQYGTEGDAKSDCPTFLKRQ